jgi:hypothetical protein
MDINDSEELTSRIRKPMIQAGTIQPSEDEIEEMGLNEPKQPDPLQVALLDNTNMETQKTMSDIEAQEAQTQLDFMKLKQQVDKQNEDFALKLEELELKYQKDLNAEIVDNLNINLQ